MSWVSLTIPPCNLLGGFWVKQIHGAHVLTGTPSGHLRDTSGTPPGHVTLGGFPVLGSVVGSGRGSGSWLVLVVALAASAAPLGDSWTSWPLPSSQARWRTSRACPRAFSPEHPHRSPVRAAAAPLLDLSTSDRPGYGSGSLFVLGFSVGGSLRCIRDSVRLRAC